MNKYIEIFLNNEADKIPNGEQQNVNVFLPYYYNIENNELGRLFAYIHMKVNNLLLFMYDKIKAENYHYNAHQSREFIDIIYLEESLYNELKSSVYSFSLDSKYLSILNECNSFLSSRDGSSIPKNFTKIYLIKARPIFILNSTININTKQFSLKSIGSGSYANVFKYKDTFYNKFFAIKKAKKNLDDKELIRFKKEFETMKNLNFPYILEVYNYDDKDTSYTMEYADCTLKDYIDKNNNKLNIQQRLNIINQIFKAFIYIHRQENINFHRDISITNILLKKYDDDLIVVKVSDFGLVKLKESSLTSENTDFKGSLNDPELDIKGGFKDFKIEHETYALTRLIYFIITGKIRITKYVNNEFRNFIENGISKDLKLRYKNVQDMKNIFNKISLIKDNINEN